MNTPISGFQSAARFTPARDRQVRNRQIACPECGAVVGQPCQTAAGGDYLSGHCHRARRRMALRAGL